MSKMIYLYVKTVPSGLKYLGATTKEPFKYKGSGLYWKKHLKTHKFSINDIDTKIIFSTTDEEEFMNKALYYSNLWNVVESEEWANLMPESGIKNTIGRKVSTIIKEQISKSKKIQVYQYDLEGNFIQEWESMKAASENNNILLCDISEAIKCKRKFKAGGFQWRCEKMESIPLYDKLKNAENKSKSIYQYSLDGKFVKEWKGTRKPSEDLNISRTALRNNLIGLSKSVGGFIWSYNKENNISPIKRKGIKIERYDKENNYIDCWDSIIEASNLTNIHKSSISNNLQGLSKSAGGFIWKYKKHQK